MGWDWRLWTAAITGLLFIPRVNVSGEPSWWCRLGIPPDLSTRARWQSYQQRHLERVGGMDDGWEYMYIWYMIRTGYFTCRKILWHGTGFTSHPKEGVLRIFIALKNPSPLPGLNPRPSGPMASTLYHRRDCTDTVLGVFESHSWFMSLFWMPLKNTQVLGTCMTSINTSLIGDQQILIYFCPFKLTTEVQSNYR
jgi:hypothetical protein